MMWLKGCQGTIRTGIHVPHERGSQGAVGVFQPHDRLELHDLRTGKSLMLCGCSLPRKE